MKSYKFYIFIITLFLAILLNTVSLKAESNSIESANNIAELGIIEDKSSNTSEYKLDDTITRREMLKIMMRLSGKIITDSCTGKFLDLNSQDWGCKYAEAALELGYIAENNLFRPDDQVSKIEALKMIFNAKGIQREENTDWRKGYVNTANTMGIVNNFDDYDTSSNRGWIFVGADNVIKNEEFLINKTNSKIEVVFAGDMDQLSVANNFKIYPEVNTNLVWEDSKTLNIEITDIIEEDTDFTINISEEAKTLKGEQLKETISKKFKTSGVAKIDFISPEGEITDLTKNITVRFSKPIISLTTLDNQPICPINITPSLPGKCVWIATSTFQFRPDQGFPIGASYNVSIPKGIKTIAGDSTVNSEEITIVTPKFEIINTPNSIEKDSELNISFNDDIDLDNFKNNFEIEGFTNSELEIKYFEYNISDEITEIKKNLISIFPKKGDWGYDKSYNYKLKKGLKSIRGNISIGYEKSQYLKTSKLLTSYNPFIYIDESTENIELVNNFKKSQNNTIITVENPKILLNFYEEVDLNKSLFSITTEKQVGNTINNEVNDFNIKYAKQSNYIDGENIITENKKSIIIKINRDYTGPLKVKIKASEISSKSKDIDLTFYTKTPNNIESYKFINYKKSCLVTQYELDTYGKNLSYFDFGDESEVNYISLINKYNTYEKECPYTEGKYTYIINTKLTPSTDYNLTIKKELLDKDNYGLSKDYDYNFLTNKALNEDKSVQIIDSRDIILVPTDISPLGVAIKTINLDKVEVEVCEGDFNIENNDYIENSNCNSKTIQINNLGFKSNFSVINLEQILGTNFDKSLLTLKVSKLNEDKTEYEIKNEESNYYKERKTHFVRTNKSIVFKGNGEKNILWLSDFRTGELLSDEINKIERYTRESSYSPLGKYQGMIAKFFSSMSFDSIGDGLYELDGEPSGYLLITLKSGEKIFLDTNYINFSNPTSKIYITTDRPIYKPGNIVNIKGIIRKQNSENYEIIDDNINIRIRDSRYKELINETIEVSSNGTFNYEYTLDSDSSLGDYNISVYLDDSMLNQQYSYYKGGNITFSVEEFEKPDFKIETKSQKDFYLYGKTPKIDIQSDYYVGVPLSNGEGSYSITALDYHFNGGKTSGYNWGENKSFYWWGYTKSSNSSNLEYGKTFNLDNKGFSIQDIDTSKTTKDKIYNISTTITDPNTSKSLSSSTSFKILNSDTFVGMKFNKYYYDFGDTAQIDFVTVDTQGDKVGNKKINFKVYKINYNYDKNTYKTDKEEKLLIEKKLTTSGDGLVNYDYEISESGEYRFEIELENGKYKTTKNIYVSGFNLIKPNESENNLIILKDKEKYNVGDNAEFIIQSEVVGVKALVTVEKLNKILYKKVVDIESNSQKIVLPIKKEYIPNFELNVFIIKSVDNFNESLEKLKVLRLEMKELEEKIYSKEDNTIIPYYVTYDMLHKSGIYPINNYTGVEKIYLNLLAKNRAQEQVLMQEIIPTYFNGKSDVKINLDSIKIDSKLTLDKDSYLPSDKQIIELELKDNDGNPINGEAVISIVDEALLALKNNDTDIINFFYSDISNMIRTKFNLDNLIKRFEFNEENIEEPVMQNRLKSVSFGMEKSMNLMGASMDFDDSEITMDTMAMDESMESVEDELGGNTNATKLRTDFKDSAYYKAVVNVIDGKAIIEVPKLPDNLTTWVIKGYSVTSDTKVGNFETKFVVQKELNLIPSIPRFFVVGDKSEISGVLINNSNKELEIDISIDTNNLEVLDNSKKILVKANSQSPFSFEVEVKNKDPELSWEEYNTDITLTAKSGDLIDSLKVNKDIIPYSTPEYTFTNGSTYDLSYEEKINLPNYIDKDLGELDISIGASILTNLLDSIDKLAKMPMDNFYSTVSALNKASVLKGLYSKSGEIELYNNITVTDYLGFEHKLDSIVKSRIKDFEDYQNSDGGMMYYDDCITNSWRKTCSNFNLTGEFLNTTKKLQDNGYTVDQNIIDKALEYYKKELEQNINDYELNGLIYNDIDPFYTILGYDNEFIKKYILTDRYTNKINNSNIFKLKLITILQTIDNNNILINTYLKELKNSIIIEARGSLIPANSGYGNNSLSTALGLKVFINNLEGEKLIIENFARWLISQKNENGNFGNSFDTSEVIEAITNYITYTKELENIDFESKGFLNNNEVISSIFNSDNKFEIVSKSYPIKEYINLGLDNSLGFEKTGTGKLYYDIGLRYYLPIEQIEARDEGIIVNRNYYNYDEYKDAFKKECYYPIWESSYYRSYYPCQTKKVKNIEEVNSGNKGDYLIGEIELIIPHERNNVLINNYIPSGAEIVNINLDTTSKEIKNVTNQDNSSWRGGFDHIENKNDKMVLYADRLSKGTYKYTYVLKLNHKGTFHHRPAIAEVMKKPEVWGRSKGELFEIK